jgi:hypothetical protein
VNERQRRVGENEVLYREVNERVRDLSDQFGLTVETVDFVCECGRLDCNEPIKLTGAEYADVRSDGATFAIKPGHELPDTETVVEEHETYFVVRKHEDGPAQLARDADPRS